MNFYHMNPFGRYCDALQVEISVQHCTYHAYLKALAISISFDTDTLGATV